MFCNEHFVPQLDNVINSYDSWAQSCNFFYHHPLLGTVHHPILQNKTAPKINTKLLHYDGLTYFTTVFFNTKLISLPNFQFHQQYCFMKLQLAISLEIELSQPYFHIIQHPPTHPGKFILHHISIQLSLILFWHNYFLAQMFLSTHLTQSQTPHRNP